MKAKIIFFLRGILFAAVFCVLFYPVSRVLSFKYQDGIQPMQNYYDLPPDTVDVLLLGSSHMGVNVNPTQIWNDCGIAAYNCWGAMQPDWNTYYYLKECLKTQTPKLVVMDTFMTTMADDYAEYSYAVKNTMGMRFSMDKIEAVKVTAAKSSWSTLLLGLPAYHSRYSEISEDDFDSFFWNSHTEIQQTPDSGDLVYPTTLPDTAQTVGTEALTAKSEKYLRMILSLCGEKNLPIMLVASPCALSKTEQRRLNCVRQIAEEYGVEFTNYNDHYREIGIDPQTDFRDEGHLNNAGIRVYTSALEKLWKSKYTLPDRRKDSDHIWNQCLETDLKPVYTLDRQFIGDGKQNYVDTGVKLASNPLASWSILTEIEVPEPGDFDKVIFSCFDETQNNYHGFMLRGKKNGALSITCSSLVGAELRDLSGTVKIALVKDSVDLKIYCNGKLTQTIPMENIQSYDGNLLVGCEQQPNGEKYRFSPVTVHALTVYDAAVSESFVSAWSPTWPALPKAMSFVPVNSAEKKLSNTFTGDGIESYVDTGCKLFSNPESSWTLLSQISPTIQSGEKVYFSCFYEKTGEYKGLLVRRSDPGKLDILYGGVASVTVDIPTDRSTTLAVQKDRSSYTVYVNGSKKVDGQVSECTAYDGSLLVGCEQDESGNLFRYSGTTVYNLWMVQGLMSEADILGWAPEHAPEAEKPSGVSVNYTLDHSFAGNGKDRFVDTGVRLYDTTEKDWTLQVRLDRDDDLKGTVLSCFAEDPNRYRGFVIRQTDSHTFAVTAGQSYTEITIPSEKTVTLTAVKSGYLYTFYVDGKKEASTESRCAAYNGPLMLGCERRLNGGPFRFSNVKIRALSIRDGAFDAAQVKNLAEQ
ncbi:MAG: hypothetical protein LKJ17_09020 [Oscillospiraceae bacterium]|nr:hypothetical protein [Oscillospiraceae bacterium]